jgi:hypothetical protein
MQKNKLEDLPLDIMAEKALKEAVAEAIAEHKLRGHPIVVWRDGKVISIPPEGINVPEAQGDKLGRQGNNAVLVKEKQQPYVKGKKRTLRKLREK